MPGVVGELVSSGKTVARVDGRLELGPRALGNRALIADSRDSRNAHKINKAIKQGDFWMPFAPSILERRQRDYLQNSRFAPYVILAFDTTERGYLDLIAALHPFDRTARPRSVNEWNEGYLRAIEAFESKTRRRDFEHFLQPPRIPDCVRP